MFYSVLENSENQNATKSYFVHLNEANALNGSPGII